MKTEKDAREISYLILQYKYLEKLGINPNDLENSHTYNAFPEGWFSVDLGTRIKVISYALKNNVLLEESLSKYIEESEKNIKNIS